MSNDGLLKPRWKVIADYPAAMHEVGDIITTYERAIAYVVEINDNSEKVDLSDYPALFKKLEWWEDRDEKDMPEYLIRNHPTQKDVFKALRHNINATHGLGFTADNGHDKSYINWLPATEEQYITYKSEINNVKPN